MFTQKITASYTEPTPSVHEIALVSLFRGGLIKGGGGI